jgi:hypothetical protein
MNAARSASNTRAATRIVAAAVMAAIAACLLALQGSAGATASARAGLDVIPFPGTPDASTQTDISFPALTPADLRSITVVGSRSGAHPGRVIALPSHGGAAFVPGRPFTNGERVSVHVPAAGIGYSFGVAAPLQFATAARALAIRHDIRDTRTWTHTFHSENWLHPPIIWGSGTDPDPRSSGDIFTDVHRAFLQAGPLILDPNGGLLWFDPLANGQAGFDTEVQSYQGSQVLTFWQGNTTSGYGGGYDVILNHHYQQVAAVHAGNNYQADLHEFYITPQGNAFITIYAPVKNVDLSSVGGSRTGTLLDSIIQEVNIATGRVLWEWHAYGHLHLNETYNGRPGSSPYDFFHVNSVQPLPNGNLLVSARNTWALYEISMQTGKIPIVLGGKHSYFKFSSGASFSWQHHATMQADGTITVFDDGDGNYKSSSQSRALRLSLNYNTHWVNLVRSYANSPSLLAQSQGSVQTLSDGYTFVGWGAQPWLSEFTPSGTQAFSLHFSTPMESYRAFRFGWWGQPSTPPDVAVAAASKGTTVYAAWNGATEVASWRVLAGSNPDSLKSAGVFPRAAFETTMPVSSAGPYFAVQALGGGGGVRATSAVVKR